MKVVAAGIAILMAISCGVAGAQSTSGTKRALLIGINDYRAVPTLQGSLNDVAAIQEVLVTRWGFARDNVRVLTNAAATRAGVLAALDRFVREAKPNDTVYLHYSGHGSQVEDLNGDEPDGLDETLVPQDGRSGDVPDITDDELDALFARLRVAEAVIVLDSCHSGTATRGLDIRTRSLPRDTRLELYRVPTLQTRAIVPVASARYVVMSAAASDQEALDGPVDGRYHGFFSYSLARSIGSAAANASPRAVLAGVAQQLNRIKVQFGRTSMPEPQLEAPPAKLDRPLMPIAAASARIAWVETQPAGSEGLRLVRGALLGATAGSRWLVYGAGESQFVPGRALAIATVTRVAGQDAFAQVANPARPVPAGARAIAAMPPPSAGRILIRVRDVPPERRSEIETALQRDVGNVSLVGANEPAQFVVDVDRSDLRLMTADGLQLIAAYAANSANWASDFARQVNRTATAADLLSLDNPSSRLRVAARVADVPAFATRGIAVVADVQAAKFRMRRPGEPRSPTNSLQLEVTANADAYITIVDVDSEGGVNLLFPNPHQNADYLADGLVRAGQSALIPDDLRTGNRAGFHWDYGPPVGTDTLRVFASADLGTARLIRERIQAIRTGGATQALEALRRDLAEVATRDIINVGGQGSGDWATAEVTVLVGE